ncbi:MAG TPA: cation diffusion facilitator family transporter [Candidatus Dormibacteraeota bacterium]|jgi:cation diffusion facilitator family transporter|nr:cation diffusion facilitator family transporter [Candidatus Dormibacteraeota bacterium]
MGEGNGHDHGHQHDDHEPAPESAHGHTHGSIDAEPNALRVTLISSAVLGAVAALELVVAAMSGSAGVLADGLHNLADLSTTLALATAFVVSRRAPTRRFPYGYHRGEDLAGIFVVLLIVASAVASGVTSVEHLLHGQQVSRFGVALAVALVGFVGNEAVARYKTIAGRRMGSVSLVADGRHSRVDGFASLAAAAGVAGAWAGVPLLDPIAGLVLTVVIAAVAVDTARHVSARLLDEADASLTDLIEKTAAGVPGVVRVAQARARWTGRQVRAELTLEVSPDDTVARAHALGEEVRHRLFHRVDSLADVIVHLDPAGDPAAHEATRHHA